MAIGTSDGREAIVEEKELVQFDQVDEFRRILLSNDFFPGGLEQVTLGNASMLLGNDIDRQSLAKGEESLRRLTSLLNEYQEQSYLLDPHLETIVVPAVKALQMLIRDSSSSDEDSQWLAESVEVQRLAHLLYCYTKVRGYKTIIHFFPHAVEDLLPTVTILERYQSSDTRSSWELRYILLLWLSLICMIPFDLVKFDDTTTDKLSKQSKTTDRIQNVGKYFLACSGKERDAAAVVLGKLYQRKDASLEAFQDFLIWSNSTLLSSSEPSIFLATGILQTICNVIKAQSPQALEPHVKMIRAIIALYSTDVEEVARAAEKDDITMPFHYSDNSLVNKYKAKMACRLGLKILRPKRKKVVPGAVVMTDGTLPNKVDDTTSESDRALEDEEEEEDEVPEEVDAYIASLMDALRDKDTVVRYSAAKGLSRLCGRLPDSFVEQVSDAITDMFSINISDLLGKKEDLSNVSEFTWQGCCLALAELARRGLLVGESLEEKLEWVEKALVFDVRRGAHSVGTGVRDAACYVLWAIARAHKADSIRSMAERLSHRLVCVALLDRDISIRRAASAAFQECVGRLNLFEHGIDIIRKSDFYAVGVRRNAFLDCAPQVAEHPKYRKALLDHLLKITIVHWDPSMRELGASAVAKIAQIDLETLVPSMIEHVSLQCKSGDVAVLHGALSTLAELSKVCGDIGNPRMQKWCTSIFAALDLVPRHAIRTLGPSMVVHSACRLIATSVTKNALLQSNSTTNSWDDFVEAALKRQEEEVQMAAAEALCSVSRLMDCSDRIEIAIKEWKSLSVAQQQSNARVFGMYDYQQFPAAFSKAISFLLLLVTPQSHQLSTNVETRRNAFESLVNSIINLSENVDTQLDPSMSDTVLKAMLNGLEDYTTDARGDVGSWIRVACLTGMRKLLNFLGTTSANPLSHWLDQETFDAVCAGYCKQMIERIDVVRSHAAIEFLSLTSAFEGEGNNQGLVFTGHAVFHRLFIRDNDILINCKESTWLLPRVVQLLISPEYRIEVLKGVVLYIGGQKELSNRIMARSLSGFLLGEESEVYTPQCFVDDVIQLAVKNIKSNRYFIPATQTLNVLFEEGVMEEAIAETEGGITSLSRALELVCRNINVIKSIPRVLASMQYTIHMLAVASLRSKVLPRLSGFLLHPFPTVRSSTAESLYSSIQDHFDEISEEAEDLLLSTRWSQTQPSTLKATVDNLLELLSHSE